MRGAAGRCRPRNFLDDAPVANFSVNDVQPEEILALEVCHGDETQARFTSVRGCGAVVVWLRHGSG